MPTIVQPQPSRIGVNADSVATSASTLLQHVSYHDFFHNDILRTSFNFQDSRRGIVPRQSGFSNTIIRAFQQDLYLTLRPDDVWLAILVQISFFVNGKGRAESLRDRLVEHPDRRHLVVDARPASLATVDIGNVVHQMIELVKSSLRDPKMATRLLLEFSTTTENDRAIAAMAFLGTMQNYFTYEFRVGCGFPSVTLMGEREDWLKILEGLDVLSSLGDEAVPWSVCLSKVLEYMVASFDRPRDEDVKDFWTRAVHESGRNGSGAVVTLTGWLTAFSWWDPSGDRQRTFNSKSPGRRSLILGGVEFPVISADHIPASITRCPVVVFDDTKGGGKIKAELLAGISGFEIQNASLTAVRPISGWWLLARHRSVAGSHITQN